MAGTLQPRTRNAPKIPSQISNTISPKGRVKPRPSPNRSIISIRVGRRKTAMKNIPPRRRASAPRSRPRRFPHPRLRRNFPQSPHQPRRRSTLPRRLDLRRHLQPLRRQRHLRPRHHTRRRILRFLRRPLGHANGTLTQTITFTGFAPNLRTASASDKSPSTPPSRNKAYMIREPPTPPAFIVTVIQQEPHRTRTLLLRRSHQTRRRLGFLQGRRPTLSTESLHARSSPRCSSTRHSGNDLDAFLDDNSLTLFYPGTSWAGAGTTWNAGGITGISASPLAAAAFLTSAANGAQPSPSMWQFLRRPGLSELDIDAAIITHDSHPHPPTP